MLVRPHNILRLLTISASLLAAASCSSRGFFKPRSQVIEEAESQGVRMLSVDEERAAFINHLNSQKRRLLALIRQRARGESRDVNYRLGPGDDIEINVFDVAELNLTTQVHQSGFVTLPLVGAVKAAGSTEAEFSHELSRRLSSFVRMPQVSTFVTNYASQKVGVLGAVRQPGSFPLKKGANSVIELISQAGGISDKAGNFLNFVPAELSGINADNDLEMRARLALAANEDDVKSSGIEVALDQVLGTSGNIPLEIPVRAGDMIIIPEAGKVTVEGEVQKVGSYDLSQQFTLLSALAAAGGITFGAKVDEVELIREAGANKKLRLIIDLEKIGTGEEKDVRLRNGDIVRVPSDASRRLRQDTYESISNVINFGVGGNVNLVK